MSEDADRLLTPAEAAALLSISKETIRGWRRTGFGPPYVAIGARRVRYRRRDIDDFIARQLRTSTSTEQP